MDLAYPPAMWHARPARGTTAGASVAAPPGTIRFRSSSAPGRAAPPDCCGTKRTRPGSPFPHHEETNVNSSPGKRRIPRRAVLPFAAVAALAVGMTACGDDDDEPDDTSVDVETSEVSATTVMPVESEVTTGTVLTSEVEVTETTTMISEV